MLEDNLLDDTEKKEPLNIVALIVCYFCILAVLAVLAVLAAFAAHFAINRLS